MTRKAYTGFATQPDASDDLDGQRFIITQMINRLATATLVQVKAVDAAVGTVDVQPMVHQIDGAGNGIEHSYVHSLPYFTQRAGSAAIIVMPVVGDIGLAIFCHNDISGVKKTRAPALPGSRRRYSWADGLYLGGFLGPEPTTFVVVQDGHVGVKATTITLEGDVAIGGGTLTHDGVDIGSTHVHSDVEPGAGNSGPPLA